MKRILVLALSFFALSAGRLCGQTSSDLYLIGTPMDLFLPDDVYNNLSSV
jgi:hypothetical protein